MTVREISLQAVFAGLLAAFVGFASSFAVVLQGLRAAGATQEQAASGLMALSIAMGLCGIVASLRQREPISMAWSTPGAALLATSGPPAAGFAGAVGAFLATGLLIVVAGLWRPFGRAVAALPPALANAMLAGVLLGLCLAPVHAAATIPALGLPVVATWAVVFHIRRVLAVPAAVIVALALIAATQSATPSGAWWPTPVLVTPVWSWSAMAGIALPLFLVTMASQNIPGLAVLRVNGYEPAPGPLFRLTGLFSLVAAPFGGHAVNLAAITAALCAGPDAHPDPRRRYWAAVVGGVGYVLLGLLAHAATSFIAASPPILIQAVAGLALLGALGSALLAAVAEPAGREAALVTFLVTAAGQAFLGISGAFWGLAAGGALWMVERWGRR